MLVNYCENWAKMRSNLKKNLDLESQKIFKEEFGIEK